MNADDYGLRPEQRAARAEPFRVVQQQGATPVSPQEEEDSRTAVVNNVARDIRWLPLRTAISMAEEVTKLPEYKSEWPNKIELAMILNEWAFTKGED